MSSCDLCDLAAGNIITRLYYEDETCILVDCSECESPMLVFKPHREPSEEERGYLLRVKGRLFPDAWIRWQRRLIPDHWHVHLFPNPFKRASTDNNEITAPP